MSDMSVALRNALAALEAGDVGPAAASCGARLPADDGATEGTESSAALMAAVAAAATCLAEATRTCRCGKARCAAHWVAHRGRCKLGRTRCPVCSARLTLVQRTLPCTCKYAFCDRHAHANARGAAETTGGTGHACPVDYHERQKGHARGAAARAERGPGHQHAWGEGGEY